MDADKAAPGQLSSQEGLGLFTCECFKSSWWSAVLGAAGPVAPAGGGMLRVPWEAATWLSEQQVQAAGGARGGERKQRRIHNRPAARAAPQHAAHTSPVSTHAGGEARAASLHPSNL